MPAIYRAPAFPGQPGNANLPVLLDGSRMRLVLAAALLCLPAGAASADTGRDLILVCGQSASLCNSDFQSREVIAGLRGNHCLPTDAGPAEVAVVDWLGKHPKTARQDVTRAVKAAATALWPCDILRKTQ
jgi:hypothetical protein